MSRKIIIIISLLIFLISAFLLGTGSEVLVKPLIKEPSLPLGNVITWLGFIAFPLSIWFGLESLYDPETKTDRVFRGIAIALVVIGLLWAPVSFLLAGNMENNFSAIEGFQGSTQAGRIFWIYSYLIAGAPILLLIVIFIKRIALLFRKG